MNRVREIDTVKAIFSRMAAWAAFLCLGVPALGHEPGRPDRDHIVFAYLQGGNGTDVSGVRWGAMTHVGWCFLTFNSSAAISGGASFNSRSAELKPGGVAANNGVKVVAVLANESFSETVLNTVMQSASLRNTLRTNIVNIVGDPVNGCDGVNLDFEFSWGTATRDGMMIFIQDLYNDLKALTPPRELSIYTIPTWNSNQYSASVLMSHTDYVIYSGYDFASGSTMTAVGRYGSPASFSIVGNVDGYFTAGILPEKLVIALPYYSGAWNTAAGNIYGQTGFAVTRDTWPRANYNTKYRSTPYTKNNSTTANHHTRWYSRPTNPGTTDTLITFDDRETLEYKLRLAKNWPGNQQTGKRLRGVGFWSLLWLRELGMVDPNNVGAGNQSNVIIRSATDPYMLMEELFAPPTMREYRADTFEQLTVPTRTPWVTPTEGPDDQNTDTGVTSRQMAAAAGGGPAGIARVLRVVFRFTNTPNRFLFKYKPLYSNTADTPHRVDWGSSIARVPKSTKFNADVYVPSGYAGTTIRMVVRDGNNQLEKGPVFNLTTSGWRRISFDLQNDVATAYTTSEGGVVSGNGTVDTAGGGERDISFIGFEVISTGFIGTNGTIDIAQLTYEEAVPQNRRYYINELRYASAAQQFVEIYGPAGPFPSGMVLRTVSGANGEVQTTINLGAQSVPNDAAGFGYFVVGASGTSAVRDLAMTDGTLLTATPSALQLYDTTNAIIYDAVVYRGAGGGGQLSGPGDTVVTDNGPAFVGEVATGTGPGGVQHSAGRFPDGANTWRNYDDFTLQVATPGAANGSGITLPVTYDMSTVPATAFQTYQGVTVGASGVGPSPNGGNVMRVVDTAGGGVQAYIGDASLGAGGAGYEVGGEIYIPSGAEPQQAIGIGICGRQGSTFFTSAFAGSGNESGYWLIYENAAGVNLATGRPDHPGAFEFVWANNHVYASTRVQLLGTQTAAGAGITPGSWVPFRLTIQPSAAASQRLVATINNQTVYSGDIPSGGPVSGAFQAAFRENHAGAPAANEGTWLDNIRIGPPGFLSVSGWELYE